MNVNYIKLEKSAKKCMMISAACFWATVLVSWTVVALILLEVGKLGKVLLAAGWIFGILYTVIGANLRYERYRYAIDEEALRVRKGLLWIRETLVPIERLHKIETSQGPLDRFFKLSSLTVITAGGDAVIKFLPEEEAMELAEALKKKINAIAIAEREK